MSTIEEKFQLPSRDSKGDPFVHVGRKDLDMITEELSANNDLEEICFVLGINADVFEMHVIALTGSVKWARSQGYDYVTSGDRDDGIAVFYNHLPLGLEISNNMVFIKVNQMEYASPYGVSNETGEEILSEGIMVVRQELRSYDNWEELELPQGRREWLIEIGSTTRESLTSGQKRYLSILEKGLNELAAVGEKNGKGL